MSRTGSAPTIVARGRRADDAAAEPAAAGNRRGVLVVLVVVGVVLLAVVVSALTRPTTSAVELAPDNPAPSGARAAAQVLGQHGVEVTYVRTTAGAIAEAEPGTTLLVVGPTSLRDVQLEALADVEADIVLTGMSFGDLSALTDRIDIGDVAGRTNRVADCADADAQAAESITAGGSLVTGGDTACFRVDGGALYTTWVEGQQTWRVLADGWILSNEGLPVAGNAALVFRSLGATERLVWYVPDPADDFGTESGATSSLLPGPVVLQLVLIGLALVIWRGRRLGPVVVEPLPVVVKASETTRGRGRLYRRARAREHAAAALRAGFVSRVAGRVGLPAHAHPDTVIDTLARASGRSHDAIADVLYGAPPTTDDGLTALAQAIDTLESEVQNR